ncbi:hypothetical protein, partial [Clostridioides difficile]|uniref:hypothetical protein n=1 Tax=Clostridioides difficile TaxID=1496 RepID=UPI000BCC2E49
QPKAYTVKQDEIATLLERSAAVSRQEQRADQREQRLDQRELGLQHLEQQIIERYSRQLRLNPLLEKSERDGKAKDKQIDDLPSDKSTLRGQVRSLTAHVADITAGRGDRRTPPTDNPQGASTVITNPDRRARLVNYGQ